MASLSKLSLLEAAAAAAPLPLDCDERGSESVRTVPGLEGVAGLVF